MTSCLFVELDLTGEGYWTLFGHTPNMEKRKWNERIFQDLRVGQQNKTPMVSTTILRS